MLALDVGHRPLADRAALYDNYTNGDRPDDGNGTHPAIRAAALDSDWVEDGERAWDVDARGRLSGATLARVDPTRIAVTGLSMGGEVATFAGALDPRIAAVVPAGFVPDLTVMALNGNHPCWRWLTGDPARLLQHLGPARAHRAAPARRRDRPRDGEFSKLAPPFVDGKEVARRSRAAYADAAVELRALPAPRRPRVPLRRHRRHRRQRPARRDRARVDGPRASDDLDWAADGTTVSLGVTLARRARPATCRAAVDPSGRSCVGTGWRCPCTRFCSR